MIIRPDRRRTTRIGTLSKDQPCYWNEHELIVCCSYPIEDPEAVSVTDGQLGIAYLIPRDTVVTVDRGEGWLRKGRVRIQR